jgi:hypothetical protein
MTQEQIVDSENSININSIMIGFFCIKETIHHEFLTPKLAVNQASFFKTGTYAATCLLKMPILWPDVCIILKHNVTCSHTAISNR